MIPSVLASQLQRGAADFQRTTFPISTPHFHGLLERLLDEPGVGFARKEWEEIKDLAEGTVTDDTLPGGPRTRVIEYSAPFDRCDREQDYETVWAEFERRLGKRAAGAWGLLRPNMIFLLKG